MKARKTWLLTGVVLSLAMCLTVAWAGPTYTPKPGSSERQAIMDALRKPVGKALRQRVIFKVDDLRVRDGWSFFVGLALKQNGKGFGADNLWGSTTALLRKQGGRRRVLHWGFASDTSVMEAAKKKYPRAPRSIFPG